MRSHQGSWGPWKDLAGESMVFLTMTEPGCYVYLLSYQSLRMVTKEGT